jgi:hypothetical protein
LKNQLFFIAEAEKAILDLIYLQTGGDDLTFLEALRLQNLDNLDLFRLQSLARRFKSPKMTRACQNIIDLIEREKGAYQIL